MRKIGSAIAALFIAVGYVWQFGKWTLDWFGRGLAVRDINAGVIREAGDWLDHAQSTVEHWISANPRLGWVLMLLGAFSLLITIAIPWLYEKWTQSPIKIIFDRKDPRCVKEDRRYGNVAKITRFSIGVVNSRADRSLSDVIVQADRNLFVENTIQESWGGRAERRISRLNPRTTEYIELFGVDENFGSSDPLDVFGAPRRFTIRVSATDAKEIVAEFEFYAKRAKKLRRIS